MIGDTDVTKAKLQDETILQRIQTKPSETWAAAQCAYDIAALYADQVTNGLDRQLNHDSDLYDHYTRLAQRLEAQARKETVIPVTTPPPSRYNSGPIVTGKRAGACGGYWDEFYPSAPWPYRP